jgi:hypothetical protein
MSVQSPRDGPPKVKRTRVETDKRPAETSPTASADWEPSVDDEVASGAKGTLPTTSARSVMFMLVDEEMRRMVSQILREDNLAKTMSHAKLLQELFDLLSAMKRFQEVVRDVNRQAKKLKLPFPASGEKGDSLLKGVLSTLITKPG